MLMSAFFAEIQGWQSQKNAWLPQIFFADSNSPCKDLLFPRGPNVVQKRLYLSLVGTVHKSSLQQKRRKRHSKTVL